MRKDLVEYIKKNLKKGYDLETLKVALIKQGYPRASIDVAVEKAKKEIEIEEKNKKAEKPEIKYEVYDSENKVVETNQKKPFWKRLFCRK